MLTTLCYIEKDDKYLMLHRVKKENDCDEGELVWVPKNEVRNLKLWEGDKIFSTITRRKRGILFLEGSL